MDILGYLAASTQPPLQYGWDVQFIIPTVSGYFFLEKTKRIAQTAAEARFWKKDRPEIHRGKTVSSKQNILKNKVPK